jgi:hypothetical protein
MRGATNLSLGVKWEKVWDEVKYCSDKCRVTNNMANKTLRLILGDQLNSNHSWFKTRMTRLRTF